MAKFEDCCARHVADAGGRFNVSRTVAWIVSKLLHQRDVNGISVDGQDIDERTVSGIADGLLFVG